MWLSGDHLGLSDQSFAYYVPFTFFFLHSVTLETKKQTKTKHCCSLTFCKEIPRFIWLNVDPHLLHIDGGLTVLKGWACCLGTIEGECHLVGELGAELFQEVSWDLKEGMLIGEAQTGGKCVPAWNRREQHVGSPVTRRNERRPGLLELVNVESMD